MVSPTAWSQIDTHTHPGVVSQLPDGGLMVLRSLDTLGGKSRWVMCAEIANDLELWWRGRTQSVAQVLIYHRRKHLVRSRLHIRRDNGNEMASQLEWRITAKGRREAW